MGHATARRIKRHEQNSVRGVNGVFPRDHFNERGLERSECQGASAGKRVFQGAMFPRRGIALVFRHPTKKRTLGRMCWFGCGFHT